MINFKFKFFYLFHLNLKINYYFFLMKLDCIVCGIGSIGTRHVNNLLKYFPEKKVGLVRRKKISYKNLPVYDDVEKCIEETNPKYILICTPNSKHIDIAIKAAKKGIHLFIEKPLDTNLDKVPELIKIIKEKNIKCMIGFDLRFHPGILKIKDGFPCVFKTSKDFNYITKYITNSKIILNTKQFLLSINSLSNL